MVDNGLELLTSTRSDGYSLSQSVFVRAAGRYWYAFLICLFLSVLIAFLYLRYATPEYRITSSLLVRDDSRGAGFEDAAALENLGLQMVSSSIDNEIEILKSRSIIESVVSALALNVRYFASGHVKTTELYKGSPFLVRFLEPDSLENKPGYYELTLSNPGTFSIIDSRKSVDGKFGDTITLAHGRAVVTRTKHLVSPEDTYFIVITKREQAVGQLLSNLKVTAANKFASLIELSLMEAIPEKGEAILASLISQYLSNNIADKNRVADNTLAFIERNLAQVAIELGTVESRIEDFRKSNQLLDATEESRQLIQRSNMTTDQLNESSIKLKIIKALAEYTLANPMRIIPSSLIQQEANFGELASKYNDLILQRSKELVTVNKAHPAIVILDNQIKALRSDMLVALENQQKELGISLAAFRQRESQHQYVISQIPGRQRVYLDFTRQQQIKQELYLFLLKKQIETSISRSSTISNAKVIDSPKADPHPFFPNRRLIFLISACVGLGVPAITIHVGRLFTNKITDKAFLLANCKVPLIAEICYLKSARLQFLLPDSKSLTSEQFRSLRVNLVFTSGSARCQTIMITSGGAGEGKSFIAANLAQSFAINDKRVLLLELDLRKPSLARHLHLRSVGCTDYLFNQAGYADLIQNSGSTMHFDVLTSGFPPSNPAELLSTSGFEKLISELKEKYDHIIIDTPPVGLVTDAHMLRPFVDLTLYVVRQGLTTKQQLQDLNRLSAENRLPCIHLVYNCLRRAGGNYRYYEEELSGRSFFKWAHNFKLI